MGTHILHKYFFNKSPINLQKQLPLLGFVSRLSRIPSTFSGTSDKTKRGKKQLGGRKGVAVGTATNRFGEQRQQRANIFHN